MVNFRNLAFVSMLFVLLISPILLLPYAVLTRDRNYEAAAYQLPLLNATECTHIINEAEAQAQLYGWSTRRHASYPTTDISLRSVPSLRPLTNVLLSQRIFPALTRLYNVPRRSLHLNDMFVVKYDSDSGQAAIEPHMDGSQLSFNIALNSHGLDFEGGGTGFALLGPERVIHLDKGHMLAHPSKAIHEGVAISKGIRYMLVGFVYAHPPEDAFLPTMWGMLSTCFVLRSEKAGDAPSFMSNAGTEHTMEQMMQRCSTLPTELWRGLKYSVTGGSAMAYGVCLVGVMFVTLIIIVMLMAHVYRGEIHAAKRVKTVHQKNASKQKNG